VKLNYKSFGEGFPVIILHGLFGSLDNWQTIARKLSENYRVFTIDLRNHGKSPHSDVFDLESMAEDLKEFMEGRQIEKAHLIGHSMGGKVIMEFAFHCPGRTEKMIVADIGPKAYPRGHDQVFKALNGVHPETIDSRQEAERRIAQYISSRAVQLFLLKNLHRDKDNHYQWKMNLPVIEKNYEKILKPIVSNWPFDHPVLFIRGGKSPYVEDDDMPEILDLFPNARLATIPDAGHWIHAEALEEFLKLVMGFLE
jgi:esterase